MISADILRLWAARWAVALLLTAACTVVAGQTAPTVVFAGPERPAAGVAPSHRIPALVQCSDGALLAVADRRRHLSDIGTAGGGGVSQIELLCRRSTDGGATWSEAVRVGQCVADTADWRYALGDAALVADRESGEVLLLCAAGCVSWMASVVDRPIRIAAFRSHDNGMTWDEGTDVTDQIYGLYGGEATAAFITSGSLCQSRLHKVGPFFRIYAAHPLRTATRGNTTSVVYSDDFGRSWHLLGRDDWPPRGMVCEEGKAVEMSDGSVALMVRDDRSVTGVGVAAKNFNVFRYDDARRARGRWSEAVSGIDGTVSAQNSALAVVRAHSVALGGREVWLALTALPVHDVYGRNAYDNYGRRDATFFYKEMGSAADYDTGLSLASHWRRGMQVTALPSAYADMQQLSDGSIGLLLEDNGRHGTGIDGNDAVECYDIVFRRLSLRQVTEGLYW